MHISIIYIHILELYISIIYIHILEFKQTLKKVFVTKKQLLVLIKIIPFYKLMLVIMGLLQKTHRNTKIKITITKKYHRAKKVKMHDRMKRKHPKGSPRKIKTNR